MELKDTIDLMNSSDYKDRFKAEYWQVKIRLEKLRKMIAKWQSGTLGFTPSCSLELLKEQVEPMQNYLDTLEVRAEMEGNRHAGSGCMATTWHGFGTVVWLDSKLLPTKKRPTTVCTISEVTTGLPPPAIPTKAKTHNQPPEAFCFRGFFHPSRNIQIVFSLHLFPVCMHRLDSPGPTIVC